MWGWLCRCLKPRGMATAHKLTFNPLSLQTADVHMEIFWNILHCLCLTWRRGRGAVPGVFMPRCSTASVMPPGSSLSRCRDCRLTSLTLTPLWSPANQTQLRVAPPSKWNHQSLHYRASLCSPWWVISNFSSTFSFQALEPSRVDKVSKTVVTVHFCLCMCSNNSDCVTINTTYAH